jgi:gluconokinase
MDSLVVMGVSGCGKSHVAAQAAQRLGLPLVEGDEFHSAANRALMREGIALTDAHRADWLDRLGLELQRRPDGMVLTCSALKAAYRQRLRSAAPGLRFAWLDLDLASAQARVAQRPGHFFPPSLVATQFEALEAPTHEAGVLRLDALQPPQVLVERICRWMR